MLIKKRIVIVAKDEDLRRRSYFLRLQLAVRNAGISDREWPTVIQDMFLRADMRGTVFQYESKEPFPIPLVDDVWRNERYVREFLASGECEYPQKDRLIDLYFRVEMPNIARHFGR